MKKLMMTTTAATALLLGGFAYAQTDTTDTTGEPLIEQDSTMDPAVEPADPTMDPAAEPATDGELLDPAAPEVAEGDREMMTAPEISMEGFEAAKVEDLTADDLTGARVYGINDEDIGEIDELLLTDDGKIDRAVIDVGGFLGLGEKAVALTMDELTIMRGEDGGDFRVYVDSTEEALEEQPEYDG